MMEKDVLLLSVASSLMAGTVNLIGSPFSPERTEGVHQSHSPESSHVSAEETVTESSPPSK